MTAGDGGQIPAYRETKLLDRDQINVMKAKELQTNQLLIDCVQGCIDAGYCTDIDPELTVYWVITTRRMHGG